MPAVAAPAPPEGDGRGIHEMFENPRRIFFKLVMFFKCYLALILVRSDGTASLPAWRRGAIRMPAAGGRSCRPRADDRQP